MCQSPLKAADQPEVTLHGGSISGALGMCPSFPRQMGTPDGLLPQTPGHCLVLLPVKEEDRQSPRS